MLFHQVGFEQEFFVINDHGEVVEPKRVATDACGYLAEVRSDPHSRPNMALAMHLENIREMDDRLTLENLRRAEFDHTQLDPTFLLRMAIRYGKPGGTTGRQNLYGHEFLAVEVGKFQYAGLHLHFSPHRDKDGKLKELMDIPRIVRLLDEEFRVEILAAQRMPGWYEFKRHGFEYRSLPTTVNLRRVAEFLSRLY